MSERGDRRVSDAQLREALTRRPDASRLSDDLATIVATAEQTRQGHAAARVWLLAAAALIVVLLALLAAVVGSSLLPRRDAGRIAIDVGRDILVVGADGSDPRTLTSGPETDWDPIWSPDRTRLVYWASEPLQPGDTCGISCAFGPRRLMLADQRDPGSTPATVVTTVAGQAGWRISWAPDSHRLVIGDLEGGVRVIVVVDVRGGARTRIGPADLDGWDPAWSPDGRHIAFVRGHEDLARRGLYVMDADGSNLRRLTTIASRGAGFLGPVWSPAGDRLAFAAETGGPDPFQKDIWVVGLDGSPEVDVSNDPADEDFPTWSPDGGRLAYLRSVSPGSLRFHPVVSAVDAGTATTLPEVVGDTPMPWSPDGSRILAVELGAGTGGQDRVVTIDVATGTSVVVIDGHPDGVGAWR